MDEYEKWYEDFIPNINSDLADVMRMCLAKYRSMTCKMKQGNEMGEYGNYHFFECGFCGNDAVGKDEPNYCPNCGRKVEA